MKKIDFSHLQQKQENQPRANTNKELLINDIADQCYPPEERPAIRRRLAIAANTAKWTEMDLHALLKKRQDPSVRNYTALVKWSTKIRRGASQK